MNKFFESHPLLLVLSKSLPVLLMGLLLSVYVSSWVKTNQEQELQNALAFHALEVKAKIDARLQVHQQLLRGAAALFDADPALDRNAWRNYAQRMQFDKQLDGVQGVGFALWIPKEKLSGHVSKILKEGLPDYKVFPAGDRKIYTSVIYLEPSDARNSRALGLDMYAEPTRRAAMERARDQNLAVLSGAVDLLVEPGLARQVGTLMYVPVYKKHAVVDTVEQRRAAFVGWVFSPFRMNEWMQSILPHLKNESAMAAHLKVYDGPTVEASQLMFDSDAQESAQPNYSQEWSQALPINFNGNVWTLDFELHKGRAMVGGLNSVWITFLVGAVISALLFLLAISHFNTIRRARRIVEELSQEILKRDASEREQNDWMRVQSAALQASANAILILGADKRILWSNQAFFKLTGYAPSEALGHSTQQLLDSGQQDQNFYDDLWSTVMSGQDWTGELTNRRKDGTLYIEEMSMTPVPTAQGVNEHFIVFKKDISERKRLDQLLHEKNVELEKATQTKSEFLANMSHEMRTPMNGVIGMVDIMQQMDFRPEQHRMLDTIHKSAMSLLNILNDILDYSKIEAGKLALESIPVNVREVVEGVAQLLGVTARAKSVELVVFVSPALPPWIWSDPTRLRQVLFNLLGNAIKFTSSNPERIARVELWVQPCLLASGSAGMRLSFIDNGIGMSAQEQAVLFTPFTQADQSTARKFGGSGLGLSICRHLVEMMGCHISVRSNLGEGAEFTVELPLLKMAQDNPSRPNANLHEVMVLLVTQDETTAKLVSSYVLDAGADVTVVRDLHALLQQLPLPDTAGTTVVLLGADICVQHVDFELPTGTRVIRLQGLNRSFSEKALASEIKLNAFPLLYDDLIYSIAHMCERLINGADDTPAPTRHLLTPQTPPTVAQALKAGQLILLAEDNETNREVIQAQLFLLGYACEVAVDGAQALEMWRSGRYALLLTDCHMPRMNGFELTAAIRQSEPAGKRFPIVAITANALQGEAQRCLAQGMDDYLSKPIRMMELSPLLDKWLLLPSKRAESIQVVKTWIEMPVWDAHTLEEMVGDSPEMQARLLKIFLADARKQVVSIELAVIAGDLRMTADVAHALKSAARMVGALQMGELCEEIETLGAGNDAPACYALVKGLDAVFLAAQDKILAANAGPGLHDAG